MVKQAVREIPEGPIDAGFEAIPEGEGVGHVEAPRGETFHYIRSDGSNYPYRHKIRAPSYVNVPSFKASCIGQTVSDVCLALAAVDPCYSCTERVAAVIDSRTKKRVLNFNDLVRLSQEKTRRLMRDFKG
jgi:NADH-quinone oxidoreductase subunit D